jgi:hypothetical protein
MLRVEFNPCEPFMFEETKTTFKDMQVEESDHSI